MKRKLKSKLIIMKNIINKEKLLFIGIGILIGVLLVVLFKDNKENNIATSVENTVPQLVQQVKEKDQVCPIDTKDQIDIARVTFLPVPIPTNERETPEYEAKSVGTKFDPVGLSKDLYNQGTGGNGGNPYPWLIQDMTLVAPDSNDKVKIYYGNIAMNHTPHIAYVVNDGIIIFVAARTGVYIEQSTPNGIEVAETLDWDKGKYKRTKYEYVNSKFTPVWYQISCNVTN